MRVFREFNVPFVSARLLFRHIISLTNQNAFYIFASAMRSNEKWGSLSSFHLERQKHCCRSAEL